MNAMLLFSACSAMLLCSALMVVFAANPVRAVFALILSFLGAAGLWLSLEADFLAMTLIVVYVGAVMVLFLFVVMMLPTNTEEHHARFNWTMPLGVLLLAGLFFGLSQVVGPGDFGLAKFPMPVAQGAHEGQTQALGQLLFTEFLLPFQMVGFLLLTAMICAMAIAYRGPIRRRAQSVEAQIAVKASERLQLCDIPSGPTLRSRKPL